MSARSKTKLTPRQAKFVRQVVKHPTATLGEAAMMAGYSNPQAGSEVMALPDVRAEFQRLMANDERLKNPALLKRLGDGLEATKPDPFTEKQMPDYSVRHRYLDTALRLTGALDDPRESGGGAGSMTFILAQQMNLGAISPDGRRLTPPDLSNGKSNGNTQSGTP